MSTSVQGDIPWAVSVVRAGRTVVLGQVIESTESLARCAALHRIAVCPDDGDDVHADGHAIFPEESFDVAPR